MSVREISASTLSQAVYELFLDACVVPCQDVLDALAVAQEEETGAACEVLRQLSENARIAAETRLPSCQDTGMSIVYLDIGRDVHITGNVVDAVNDGVRRAYHDGYFRKSVLTPLGRVNTGDNTPAIIHERMVEGDRIHIWAMPKGFGSENMSAVGMLKPSDGIEGVCDFIVDCAKKAGPNPCPPVILGVGIGGSFEYAAYLAKRALLRKVGSENPISYLAELERSLRKRIKAMGYGPMGLGGHNYCLAVHIDEYPTHLASLPVAVSFSCHALRHAECEI